MKQALWEEALTVVPDEEIARLVNHFKISLGGFGSHLSSKSVAKARRVIEAQLKTQRQLYELHRKFRDMVARNVELSALVNSSADDLWERLSESRNYLPLWCLLADGSDASLEKARFLLDKLKSSDTEEHEVDVNETANVANSVTSQELERRLNVLQQELEEVRAQLKKAKRQAKDQLDKVEQKLADMRRERSELKEQLKQRDAKIRSLERELEQRADELAEMRQAMDALSRSEQALRQELFAKDETIAALQRKVEEQTVAVTQLERLRIDLTGAGTEVAAGEARATVGDEKLTVAVLGPPSPLNLPEANVNVETFAVSDLEYFMGTIGERHWHVVCVLESFVTPRMVQAICERVGTESLKKFDSITDVKRYLLTL